MPPERSFPDVVPTLAGERLSLREVREADLPAWFQRATDAESADLAGDPVPTSMDQGSILLQRIRDRFRARAAIRWAVVPAGGTASVGTVGLAIDRQAPGVAALSVVIGRAWWGQGLGTAAVRMATAYGFVTLGLVQVQAEVLQRNPASIRLLEKAGFQRRAAFRSEDDGEDCFLYGLDRPPAPAA